ncbi:MAG: patatin-like phospholipase family protein [Gemmatimonadales bacterium]
MTSPRVVVVLGGGGAKTAAHLGAARALREGGIMPVRWIGTSMGAVMAAALATGEPPDSILARVITIRRNDVLRNDWLSLVRGIWARQLFKPEPVRRLIERLVPARTFAELATPCTVTAVEVASGKEVAFGTDGEDVPLIDALAAACALPPYFPPVRVGGRTFYDGGLRAAVPIGRAVGIECNFVVAIHTAPGFDESGPAVEAPPPLVAASDTAMGWLMAGSVELQRERWDLTPGRPPLIWLRPVSDRGAMFAADRTARYADAGYRAMRQVLEEMK